MSGIDAPPAANPVLTAYQGFVSTTPLVTRYVITLVSMSYLASWFVDPTAALANIPKHTIQDFEVYRVVTAQLLCTSLLNLIFAYLSFVENGKRLEYAMGSGSFAYLLFILSFATNILHVVFSYTIYFLFKNPMMLYYPAQSIWIVVLALIAAECSKAPRDSKRKLFIVEVPTLYFPVAILALFTLFSGGLQIPFLFAVLVGYAYGHDKMNMFQVSQARVSKWEGNNGCLVNFTRKPGWVYGHSAQGSGAWTNSGTGGGTGGAPSEQQNSWAPSAFRSGRPANDVSAAASPEGTVAAIPQVSKPEFPKGRGQALGGGQTSSSTVNPEEARRARLEALERRRADSNV